MMLQTRGKVLRLPNIIAISRWRKKDIDKIHDLLILKSKNSETNLGFLIFAPEVGLEPTAR